jgi:hypothetical protein
MILLGAGKVLLFIFAVVCFVFGSSVDKDLFPIIKIALYGVGCLFLILCFSI